MVFFIYMYIYINTLYIHSLPAWSTPSPFFVCPAPLSLVASVLDLYLKDDGYYVPYLISPNAAPAPPLEVRHSQGYIAGRKRGRVLMQQDTIYHSRTGKDSPTATY